MKYFKTLLCSLLAFAFFIPTSVLAEYPEKPISMYIAFGAGGSTDSMARIISKEIKKILKQQVVPINLPGGGGTVCMTRLAGEKADGYVIAAALTAQLNRIPIQRKTAYKPLASFTPIYAYAAAPAGIVTYKDSRFNTLKEMIDFGKKNPGKLKYGVGGAGTTPDVSMRLIEMQAGFNWISIPFKGSMEALTALMGKHVDVVASGPKFVSMHLSGQVRTLAVLNDERLSSLPDVPTTGEQGFNVPLKTYFAFYAPAGLPADRLAILENAFAEAVKSQKVKEAIDKFAMAPVDMNSSRLSQYLEKAWPEEEQILKDLGIIKKAATSPR